MTVQFQSSVGMLGQSLFLHALVRVRGTSTSPRVLYRRLPLHRHAREAKVWAELEDRAHR